MNGVTIRDIMNKKVVTITSDATALDAAKKMAEKNIGAIIITDKNRELIGIFSERDIYTKVMALEKNPAKTNIKEVMTKKPKILSPDAHLPEAFELTEKWKFRHIPIVKDKKLVGIISVRDINRTFYSERQQLQERERLNEIKTKFAVIAAHSIKSPTTIIMMCTNFIMKEYKELSDNQKDIVDTMNRNVKRLKDVLDSLKKLYLGESLSFGKDDLKLSSLKNLMDSSVDNIKSLITKYGQHLSVEIDKDIPEILIEPTAIKQVLDNLLINASRFTPDTGKITVRMKNEKNNIRVEVEDNGIGIPKDKLLSVFESFYEVQDINKHSSREDVDFKSAGMGLGLAIAKNIIDAHKGKIWVESELNKFSKFIFTLPKRRTE